MIQNHFKLFKLVFVALRGCGAEMFTLQRIGRRTFVKCSNELECKNRVLKAIFLHRILLGILLIQGIFAFKIQDSVKWESYFPYMLQIILQISFHGTLATVYFRRGVICNYINGLLDFPYKFREFVPKHRIWKESTLSKVGEFFAYLSVPTVTVFGLGFIYLIHWSNPCTPTITFSFLLPECYSWKRPTSTLYRACETFLKLAIFIVNHWSFSTGVYAAFILSVGFGILATITLTQYLEL